MIKINDEIFNVEYFPDGTQRLLNFPSIKYGMHHIDITWLYENDIELTSLIFIMGHIKNDTNLVDKKVNLILPYVPNARMDRTKDEKEILTLKYFCEIINYLNFDSITILDPHSDITTGFLNKVKVMSPNDYIQNTINIIKFENNRELLIYFPDDGAMKRYKDLECLKDRKIIFGRKQRDWKTGIIKEINIYNTNEEKLSENSLMNKDILMIDDIISYGGTLAFSADKLKEYGAISIYAYASHTENSVLDEEKGTLLKRLKNGNVDTVFTTNSIYSKDIAKIVLIKKF